VPKNSVSRRAPLQQNGSGWRALRYLRSRSCVMAVFSSLETLVRTRHSSRKPSSPRPEAMTRAQFEAILDGRPVLMAPRAQLSDLTRRFDITWFLGAVHKYRYLLAEVLVASFFLQLFALVTPLFFQVVIDKVLVHRSLSTLDVLMIGLVAIALFEGILGTLRTYLFAHTTNRVDVELGARLFSAPVGATDCLFSGAAGRRFGGTRARAG